MILEFPGTRGEIQESSSKHRYHSSLIIRYENTNILIDFGEKHAPSLESEINDFDAILITHAHPDHYIWTVKEKKGVTIPVYLTEVALNYSKNKPLNYKIIKTGKKIKLKDLMVTAYKVIHSLRCPAVCYRIENDNSIVYAPDIVDIEEEKEKVFKNVDMLIADGSSLNINMVRRRDNKLFGHTKVRTIIGWCIKYGVSDLIITHCGRQLVTMDEKELENNLNKYADGRINIEVAYDGYIREITKL